MRYKVMLIVVAFLILCGSAFAQPYAYVTNVGSNNISVIDAINDTVVGNINTDAGPTAIVTTPDGKKAYVTSVPNSSIEVIDLITNKTINVIGEKWATPWGLAVSPDGKRVYATNMNNNTTSVIDTATDSIIATVKVGYRPQGVIVSPDGSKVYVANQVSDDVSVISTATNQVIDTISNAGSNLLGVAISPDGEKLYVVTNDKGNISVINTTNDNIIAYVPVGTRPQRIAVTPDGTKAYVTNYISNNVSVIDATTNTITADVPVGRSPIEVAVSSDGKKVYVTNYASDNLSVIDTATNTVIATVNAGGYPYGVSFGQFINPLPILPVANFSVNTTEGNAPLTVQFTDFSTNATSVKWDFGDGNNSTDVNPIHTYSIAGNYTANLTVSNENGTDSKLATITVSEKPVPLVANFSASPTLGNALLNVSFTDNSIGTPTAWNWIFGDGNTSTIQNPTHIYSKVGNYTVTLTVSNAGGSNTAIKTNYIKVIEPKPKPIAVFTASPTSGNVPLKVKFTDKSTNNPASWKWSFGDGAYSTVKNPTYTYNEAGKYTVSLTVKNAAGTNTKAITNYITVKPAPVKPVADFSASPTSGNIPLKVQFTDKSTGSPTSWKWTFGDGKSSTVKNPVYTYSKAGKYTVALIATNVAGSSTLKKSNYINVVTVTKPVAAFSVSPTSGKHPLNVKFTDKSTGSPTSWSWNFGDKSTSTVHNPAHKYTKAGKYPVKLTVKNAAGSSSKTMVITVK